VHKIGLADRNATTTERIFIMKGTAIRTAAALVAMLAATACGSAAAAVGNGTLLGEALPDGASVDKVVRIDANTPWANAVGNESVKFSVGGTEFSWRFPGNRAAVNLKEIAPAGFVDRDLYIYLQPDSRYTSGS
jgi:hypothetical protein